MFCSCMIANEFFEINEFFDYRFVSSSSIFHAETMAKPYLHMPTNSAQMQAISHWKELIVTQSIRKRKKEINSFCFEENPFSQLTSGNNAVAVNHPEFNP